MSELPGFTLPTVFDNPKGWGPSLSQPTANYKDIPYVPFSKGDKVNRVANWFASADGRDQRDGGRGGRGKQGRDGVQQTYGSNAASSFVYQAEEDEKSFSVVDNRGAALKKIGVRAVHGDRTRGGGRGGAARGPGGMQRLGHAGGRGGGRGGFGGAGGSGGGFRRRYGGWRDFGRDQHHRLASVKPTDEWELIQEIEFSRMADLSFSIRHVKEMGTYGKAGVYDHLYDRVNTRLERPLKASGTVRYDVTASEDPVLAKIASDNSDIKVFATDAVVAMLMASTVSFSAWDIVVNRVGDKLFLDKRGGGPLDFPSVNENAIEPPPESGEKAGSINSATMLAAESRDIVRKYIKQITSKATIDLEHPNPFNEDGGAEDDAKSVDDNAYRYRVFDLTARTGNDEDEDDASADASGAERCFMAVRTEIDGFTVSGSSKQREKQLFIRALTQHDINATGAGDALDWRTKLDSQRAAVIAIENKNNSSKIARWAFQAILADADQMRIGFVSRATPRDRTRHGILGFQSYTPTDLLAQHKLTQFKGWGIIKAIVDMCLQLEEGRYVIMRDPNRSVICMYSVPLTTFDNDDDASTVASPAAADDASEL
ncbi:hypothetical protein EV175_002587 [Coemansia sp. RSA 1933]|nr:hypothetical protein EV175_002587 [Coemansia sp. RSA 1933]